MNISLENHIKEWQERTLKAEARVAALQAENAKLKAENKELHLMRYINRKLHEQVLELKSQG